MAMTPDRARSKPQARETGTALVDAVRARQFRNARWNTIRVRALRVLLPICCVGLIAAYGISAFRSSDWSAALPSIPIPRITPENLTMDNPRYDGFTKDGGSYFFVAETAQQDFTDLDVVTLRGISGEMTDAKKLKTVMKADGGTYQTRKAILELEGNIEIDGEDGTRARLSKALINSKDTTIESDAPVDVAMKTGRITANSMLINRREKAADFKGNVQATLTPNTDDAGKPDNAEPQRAAKPEVAGTMMMGSSKAPVTVNAQELRVRDGEARATFTGLVQAAQDDAYLATEILDIEYENQSSKDGSANSGIVGAGAASGKIRRIIAPQQIAMRRGADQQVTANSAVFLPMDERATLTGNVVISSGTTRSARADLAELDAKSDAAVLTGSVIVLQEGNVLRGERLSIDRTSKLTTLTAAQDGSSNGRITAHLVPGGGKAKDKKKADKPKSASAASGLGSFVTDPDAPVDIEAGSLVVDDNAKTATFKGNVIARQGGFTIRTPELVAHYSGEASLGDTGAGAKDAEKSAKSKAPELTKIEAKRDVKITSDNGQKASGEWARFDVVKNTVDVGGDVELSQGQNVVRGTSLAIDMASGLARIATAPGSAPSGWASTLSTQTKNGKSVSGAPAGVGARGGRPSAVFYPQQMQDAMKSQKNSGQTKPAKQDGQPKKARPKSAKPAASSWDAQTTPQ